MNLTGYEKETIILFNEAELTATVFTYNGRLKRRLAELCKKFPNEFSLEKDDGNGAVTYRCPKKRIQISNPRNTSELISETPSDELSED